MFYFMISEVAESSCALQRVYVNNNGLVQQLSVGVGISFDQRHLAHPSKRHPSSIQYCRYLVVRSRLSGNNVAPLLLMAGSGRGS